MDAFQNNWMGAVFCSPPIRSHFVAKIENVVKELKITNAMYHQNERSYQI
jgi:hypothetical protein